MITVSVKTNIRAATKGLRRAQRKQVPYAVKIAINKTAKDVVGEVQRQMPMKLDRPTPFTKNGIAVQKGDWATKRRLGARVSIRPVQAAYLGLQVHGGTRRPKARAIPVPVGSKLNKFGNIPRGEIKKLLAKPNTFSGTIKGVAGIWERGHYSKKGNWVTKGKSRASNIRLLVAWEPRAQYRPRFPFYKIARGKARAVFPRNMNKALAHALKTAK